MEFMNIYVLVHGSMDKIVPIEEAIEFSRLISNHKLCIMEGADHRYTSHQKEMASAVASFIKRDYGKELCGESWDFKRTHDPGLEYQKLVIVSGLSWLKRSGNGRWTMQLPAVLKWRLLFLFESQPIKLFHDATDWIYSLP